MQKDVYEGHVLLHGKSHEGTLNAAYNYAATAQILHRHGEVKSFLKNEIPRARRVLGESHDTTFTMRWVYAEALCKDEGATVNDLREGVETLEDTVRIARRVLGNSHPTVAGIEESLGHFQAALNTIIT